MQLTSISGSILEVSFAVLSLFVAVLSLVYELKIKQCKDVEQQLALEDWNSFPADESQRRKCNLCKLYAERYKGAEIKLRMKMVIISLFLAFILTVAVTLACMWIELKESVLGLLWFGTILIFMIVTAFGFGYLLVWDLLDLNKGVFFLLTSPEKIWSLYCPNHERSQSIEP